MRGHRLPFHFPPKTTGAWRPLDRDLRVAWLWRAQRRCFARTSDFVRSTERDRTIVLDGRLVDDMLGFYCAIGEAVNGPGGYFGQRFSGFYDSLCGGFGLELPYTIVWEHSAQSKLALGSAAMLEYLAESPIIPEDLWTDEGRAAQADALAGALRGERTFFAEVVDAFRTLFARGGRVPLILA